MTPIFQHAMDQVRRWVAPREALAAQADPHSIAIRTVSVSYLTHCVWPSEQRRETEMLVNQVHLAVVLGKPQLGEEKMEMASFTKRLYDAGEIDLCAYLRRMHNLFPVQMQGLSRDIKRKIARLFESAMGMVH